MNRFSRWIVGVLLAILVVLAGAALSRSDSFNLDHQVASADFLSPVWAIFRRETNRPVRWIRRLENPRFAIYDSNTDDVGDDMVWDRETGLVWERAPRKTQLSWYQADDLCYKVEQGGRFGWRLPTVEELATLIDLSQPPPTLPAGHPFETILVSPPLYWSSSTNVGTDESGQQAWGVRWDGRFGSVSSGRKTALWNTWCVRGGQGKAAY